MRYINLRFAYLLTYLLFLVNQRLHLRQPSDCPPLRFDFSTLSALQIDFVVLYIV